MTMMTVLIIIISYNITIQRFKKPIVGADLKVHHLEILKRKQPIMHHETNTNWINQSKMQRGEKLVFSKQGRPDLDENLKLPGQHVD